ncbi:unnamed protein product [Diabrotica balteata]|uniref:Uncharacterized protein n=1 Tax=Diabrotica balteata TaxID=107213 RepID=A0A9N9SKL3_DIABA|nr:unnamed protein product [Diabrotica balteata]
MKCMECKKDGTEEEMLYCDSCDRPVHKDNYCSGLCSSEIRVMELKKNRVLQFLCQECKSGMKLVPKLFKLIEKLQNEVNDMKLQNSKYQEEDIVSEVFERQKRMNNLIIHNLGESVDKRNAASDDLATVTSIFKEITQEDIKVVKAVRFGKKNKNGTRSLKIVLTNTFDVKNILKNKIYVAEAKKIFINSDLTPQQLNKRNEVKEDLKKRQEQGQPTVAPTNKSITALYGQPLTMTMEFCANPPYTKALWIAKDVKVYKPGDGDSTIMAYGITNLSQPNCHQAVLFLTKVTSVDIGEYNFIVKSPSGIADGSFHVNMTYASGYNVQLEEDVKVEDSTDEATRISTSFYINVIVLLIMHIIVVND